MQQLTISANPDTGGPYDWNFNGGIENDYYFVESGGTSTPGPAFGSGRSATFGIAKPTTPQNPAIAFSITQATTNALSWNVPVSSTPQFSYTIKINGSEVASGIEPEARSVTISANLGDSVELILEDILERTTSHSDTIRGGASVNAGAISINFTESAGHANQQIAPATDAGLSGYIYTHWNLAAGASGTLGSLIDSAGTTTASSVTWSSANTWGDGTANTDASAGVGDAQIARGYLDDGDAGISINITGHGYSKYDVVVYFSTDDVTGDPYAPIAINGMSVQTTGARQTYASAPGWDATDAVTLTGQTAETLTVTASRNGDERSSIAGIQMVNVITYTPGGQVMDLAIAGPVSAGTRMELTWTAENGKLYGVETNSSLGSGDWTQDGADITGTGVIITNTHPIGVDGQLFYRIRSK